MATGTFPVYDFRTLRYMGVLQRIAICYGLIAALVIFATPSGLHQRLTKRDAGNFLYKIS